MAEKLATLTFCVVCKELTRKDNIARHNTSQKHMKKAGLSAVRLHTCNMCNKKLSSHDILIRHRKVSLIFIYFITLLILLRAILIDLIL